MPGLHATVFAHTKNYVNPPKFGGVVQKIAMALEPRALQQGSPEQVTVLANNFDASNAIVPVAPLLAPNLKGLFAGVTLREAIVERWA